MKRYTVDFEELNKRILHKAVEETKGKKMQMLRKIWYNTFYNDINRWTILMKNLIKLSKAGIDIDWIVKIQQ